MRSHLSFGTLLIWLQATLAEANQIQELPEIEFLSDNLTPSECVRFNKLFKRQFVLPGSGDQNGMNQPREFGGSLDCKKLLSTSWLTMEPKLPIAKAHELLGLKLRQIGRTDLAQWLGYNNVIRHRELYNEGMKSGQDASKGNVTKEDDHHSKVSTVDTDKARTGSKQTLLQKLVITMVAILSMTTLCLFCYKILYGRMRVGHFTAFRREEEFDEESWLRQDEHQQQIRERGAGSSCNCTAVHSDTKRLSFRNSVDRNPGSKNLSIVEYFKSKFKRHADSSRDKRTRQFQNLVSRLQNTCPTERKIIHLTRKEQSLLKSLNDVEKSQLPATDSDIKFLVANDCEKEKLLAREARREFLVEFRKRLLERMRNCDSMKKVTLNETERDIIKKLSKSERMFLPITNKDLELLVTSPFEKRRVMLKQIANKFSDITPEDRKYLELEHDEKKLLKDIDDQEKKKLGLTDSELRFLVASKSQRNIMQRRLDYRDREYRVKEIRKRLWEAKNDVSRLELTKIERSTFLSLNYNELRKLGLTEDHIKYYAATDSERRIIWPSPSQQRNLRIDTLRTKLSKLPWKECGTRLTSSEHALLASLTPGEQMRLRISDSEKNFMLSTDSEKELIKRQRRIEKLEAKIRDFNTVTMSESERGLMVSLSPSEMEMLNAESTKNFSMIEPESQSFGRRRETRIKSLGEKMENSVNLSNSQVSFLLRNDEHQEHQDSPTRCAKNDESNNDNSHQGNETNCQDEIYDELGMRFSQNVKRQARPCQRKYCLLGRHLRRGAHHDERQCRARQNSCRGFSNEERPSRSGVNVSIDTYDEFNSMKGKNERKIETKCGHCVNGVGNS